MCVMWAHQLQVNKVIFHNNVRQRKWKVDPGDVGEVEIVDPAGMLHQHQCLLLVYVRHYVALGKKKQNKLGMWKYATGKLNE